MAAKTVLNYLPRESVVHKLTGTTKLAFFLLFTFASMITYNTWVLLGLMAVSFAAFKLSHIKLREVRFMLIFMLVFLLLNNLFIFLFDPNQGTTLYGTRHVLFHLFWRYDVTAEQLRIGVAPLIGLIDGQIVTEDLGHAEGVDNGICQMTVCERHHNTGHVASCYVLGYGIQRGAVATSIAHDSHNIIACGVSPEDIAFAVNELKKMHGGIIVVENGQVQARLPLELSLIHISEPTRH